MVLAHGVACSCSQIVAGTGVTWEASSPSLVVGAGCCLEGPLGLSMCTGLLCGMLIEPETLKSKSPEKEGGRVNMSLPGGTCIAFNRLALEVTWCHFHCILCFRSESPRLAHNQGERNLESTS